MTATPRAPAWVLTVFAIVLPLVMIPLNLWFIPSGIWRPVFDASRGLVHPTCLAGLAMILVIVGGIFLGLGRMPPSSIGLQPETLPRALAWTVGAWLVLQVIALLGSVIVGEGLSLAGRWLPDTWTYSAGDLLGQLLGNALALR